MVGVLGREQGEAGAVEVDAVEVDEVGIALFAAHAEEVEHAVLFVHAQELGDVPIALA